MNDDRKKDEDMETNTQQTQDRKKDEGDIGQQCGSQEMDTDTQQKRPSWDELGEEDKKKTITLEKRTKDMMNPKAPAQDNMTPAKVIPESPRRSGRSRERKDRDITQRRTAGVSAAREGAERPVDTQESNGSQQKGKDKTDSQNAKDGHGLNEDIDDNFEETNSEVLGGIMTYPS